MVRVAGAAQLLERPKLPLSRRDSVPPAVRSTARQTRPAGFAAYSSAPPNFENAALYRQTKSRSFGGFFPDPNRRCRPDRRKFPRCGWKQTNWNNGTPVRNYLLSGYLRGKRPNPSSAVCVARSKTPLKSIFDSEALFTLNSKTASLIGRSKSHH